MSGRTTQYGATGLSEPADWSLSDQQRQDIVQSIRKLGPARFDAAGFVSDVEDAIRDYKGHLELIERTSPKAVRRRLRDAQKKAQATLLALQELDGSSLFLAAAAEAEPPLSVMAAKIVARLGNALNLSQEHLPKSGRSRNHAKDWLAARIRGCFEKHTSLKLSSVRGQPFEEFLKRVLGLAGEPYEDLHTLAERALSRDLIITQQPGLTEFLAFEEALPTSRSHLGRDS